MTYFEETVVPHIVVLDSSNLVVHEDELESFINAVANALESGNMPKARILMVCMQYYI